MGLCDEIISDAFSHGEIIYTFRPGLHRDQPYNSKKCSDGAQTSSIICKDPPNKRNIRSDRGIPKTQYRRRVSCKALETTTSTVTRHSEGLGIIEIEHGTRPGPAAYLPDSPCRRMHPAARGSSPSASLLRSWRFHGGFGRWSRNCMRRILLS